MGISESNTEIAERVLLFGLILEAKSFFDRGWNKALTGCREKLKQSLDQAFLTYSGRLYYTDYRKMNRYSREEYQVPTRLEDWKIIELIVNGERGR